MTELRFGPYRVVSELDSGVATTVSRARHESLSRIVAIKHLRDVVSQGSAFAIALEREATILAELSHPHIVALLDFVKTERAMGLVLEHVEGFRLDAVRESAGGRCSEGEVVTVGAALADALAHAHARGVVHRDVKPSNVLLGKHGELKLVDFGAAAYVGETDARAASSEGELAFGTPAYLAPEQLFGDEADPKSDVFSLGVLLYELASGEKPYEGRGPRSELVPLERRATDLGSTVIEAIDRCLSRQPADRPTAEELAAILRDGAPRTSEERAMKSLLAHARLVEGATPPPARRPSPAARRARAVRPGLAIAVGVAVVFVIALAATRSREPKPIAIAPELGELRVLASPWAEVWVDGKLAEVTPFARAIALPAGPHRVSLRHPDAMEEVREVRIAAATPVVVDVTMNVRELSTPAEAGLAATTPGERDR